MKQTLIIFNPSIEDGGVEKNLYLISNYLSTKIKKIKLISTDISKKKQFSHKILFISPLKKELNFKGRKAKYALCLWELFKQLIKDKNSLVISFQANLYATIICSFLNIKIITRSNTSAAGWSKNIFKNFLYKFLIKKSNQVLVNSKYFKLEMDKKFNIKSHLILNPFNFKDIKKKSYEKISEKFEKKKINLLSIGRLTDQKNHILILKALKSCNLKNKFFLRIIGKGKGYLLLKKFINQNDLKNTVKLLGYKKNPFPYIVKSDYFILSSNFEGSPNVLVETGFLGTNIISTNCPTGPREILKNGKFGKLFPVGSEIHLKKIFLKLKKKKIINKKFKNYLIKEYSFNKNCKKYYNIIKKISKY